MVLLFKSEFKSELSTERLRSLVQSNIKRVVPDELQYDGSAAYSSYGDTTKYCDFILRPFPFQYHRRQWQKLNAVVFYRENEGGSKLEVWYAMRLFDGGIVIQLAFLVFMFFLFAQFFQTDDRVVAGISGVVFLLIVTAWHADTYFTLKGTVEMLMGNNANT